MRYTIYSPAGEPIKQCATAQLTADHAQPGDVSFDADRANAYPWVSWRADVLGMVGTPFATSAEAFSYSRGGAAR